jgi:hypothetical protein
VGYHEWRPCTSEDEKHSHDDLGSARLDFHALVFFTVDVTWLTPFLHQLSMAAHFKKYP